MLQKKHFNGKHYDIKGIKAEAQQRAKAYLQEEEFPQYVSWAPSLKCTLIRAAAWRSQKDVSTCQATTQTSLSLAQSEHNFLCAHRVAKLQRFLRTDSEASEQTGYPPRRI